MGHSYSYLNSAGQILDQYKGEEPFASFLAKFFSRHKKYGSRDRKQVGHLCYCYFRLGKSTLQIKREERILIALFLCSREPQKILEELRPEWNEKIGLPAIKKLAIVNSQSLVTDVFPWGEQLSQGVSHEEFSGSFFVQPDLFLRLRPGHQNVVRKKLSDGGIDYREINSSCLALQNSAKIDHIIELDREAVVQDYSSQQVGEYFKSFISNLNSKINAWDCCAGSGGKSLLLHDLNPQVNLTVSDIRQSIIVNLNKRFAKAGVEQYRSFIADLTADEMPANSYNLIICDAPCTGSGTWGRTPEQLYFFDERKIEEYASLQKKIVSNVLHYLEPGGFLVYITCSVFKKENEELAEFMKQKHQLELIKMELLKGYDKKADSMFVSMFRRNL